VKGEFLFKTNKQKKANTGEREEQAMILAIFLYN